jgi:hypothetical protein
LLLPIIGTHKSPFKTPFAAVDGLPEATFRGSGSPGPNMAW